MNYLENRPRTLLQSLEFVTQTMTTVGYGQDPPWDHSLMYILVITIQLTGVTIVFMSIPTVVAPWVEQRISVHPPSVYDGPDDHVIITEYTSIVGALIEELENREIPYVLIESDEEKSKSLYRKGHSIIQGDPIDPVTLNNANIEDARLVILDCPDERNASISLSIEEHVKDQTIVAVANERDRAAHLTAAGIDEVIYPREKIGEVLAKKALSGLGKKSLLEDHLETQLEIQEFPVLGSSPLINIKLKNSNIREKTGAHILGIWREGEFIHNPPANFRIKGNDILVASGTSSQLNDLVDLTQTQRNEKSKNVVIVGYGKEGSKAESVLLEHGLEPSLINDINVEDRVDVIGDGRDPEILKEGGVENASTVLVTVSDDDSAILITLMVNSLNPQAETLVQVNSIDSIEPIYRAGASYVQSLQQVTSRLLAGHVLNEDLLFEDLNLRVRRCGPGKLEGETPQSKSIGEDYQISIVGVERDGEVVTDLTADYQFQSQDILYVAGEPEKVRKFDEAFDLTEVEQQE